MLLGEDRLSAHLDRVSRSGNQATRALSENSTRLLQLKNNFRSAAAEIPGLSSGLRLMTNPLALAGAGIAVVGAGLVKASAEARKFNHEFRELSNLNLDKSKSEVRELKSLVLDTAFNNGFDLSKTNTGMFDIQSITGKYGAEAARIVSKQGEFANLMNADFKEWIAGTGKAMANYGFGADQLDRYNASAYATMKAGYINFDQLAKVSSVYAGAAASAKQDFNTANKMLTLFTLKTKSADEAGTLTKSLFNDLTKQTTIDAFRKAGIDVFDANKQFRQADDLLFALNKKFLGLNDDKAIVTLKNQFAGSEGLIALIQAATDKTGALQATMNSFDKAELGLSKATQAAREDVDYINNQLKARTQVLMTEIGNNWTPIWNSVLSGTNELLGNVRSTFTGREGKQQWGSSHIANEFLGVEDRVPNMSESEFNDLWNRLVSLKSIYTNRVAENENAFKWYNVAGDPLDWNRTRKNHSFNLGALDRINHHLETVKSARANLLPNRSGLSPYIANPGTPAIDPNPLSSLTSGISAVAGGGAQTKHVTVNISKLIETQNVSATTIKESLTDIQRMVEEVMIRAIGGAEQIISM